MRNHTLCLAVLSLLAVSSARSDEPPTLTVITYDAITADWGPGPVLETAFEAECGCDLQWIATDTSGTLISRLQLEGDDSDVDVMMGIDQNLLPRANDSGLFAPHRIDTALLDLDYRWTDPRFLPYDQGYFSFVYQTDRIANPPQSLAELATRDDVTVLLQDPRSSTPGMGLVAWVERAFGEEGASQWWSQMREQIVTIAPGWSEAYGLFLEGEADAVLSYTTSPAYHQLEESREDIAAMPFSEGHPVQIELAGVLASSDQPELARQFLAFMVSPEAQRIVAQGNYMFPVTPIDSMPEQWPSRPQTVIDSPPIDSATSREWLARWRQALEQ
ncbi:thiamine ABC transporter substrate binding subunit [Gammaproteobacteria bacterium]|nr:thiamine ABC transporter substrate binding subunit [Gammaproteobacteria bacterium]